MDLGLAGLASSVVDLSLRDIPREIVKEHFDARHWSLEWTWWDTTGIYGDELKNNLKYAKKIFSLRNILMRDTGV
ncbi:hypothetical protein JTE90_023711 [Oedothorax gibbosus]|uniref:Uncharacterized protein n=1 Tax=Oedothorax gibbosus TaxID=931172 RepID=A0AAV6TQN8_9ARAC|nr:hypothetical protein JTE90_023711 [Oedothorax gibbosus]